MYVYRQTCIAVTNIKLGGRKVYFFVSDERALEGLAINFVQVLKQFVS
jgi:hypothetical protein